MSSETDYQLYTAQSNALGFIATGILNLNWDEDVQIRLIAWYSNSEWFIQTIIDQKKKERYRHCDQNYGNWLWWSGLAITGVLNLQEWMITLSWSPPGILSLALPLPLMNRVREFWPVIDAHQLRIFTLFSMIRTLLACVLSLSWQHTVIACREKANYMVGEIDAIFVLFCPTLTRRKTMSKSDTSYQLSSLIIHSFIIHCIARQY